MYGKKHRPSWWLLYLSLPMMIGLFLIEMRQPLSETGHKLAEFAILLIIFGYISLWLKANTGVMIQEDLERWRAASRTDSSPISLRQEENKASTNGNLNRRPQQKRELIYRRLATWASTVSAYFHFYKDLKRIYRDLLCLLQFPGKHGKNFAGLNANSVFDY